MSLSLRAGAAVLVAIVTIGLGTLPTLAQSPQIPSSVPAQMRADAIAIMSLCRADYERLCANVRPGSGRILACLQQHPDDLSAQCGPAIPRAEKLKADATAAGVMPK